MNKLIPRTILSVLLIAGGTFTVAAHNPLAARYHIEVGSLASELTINLSQDGVHQALLQTHDRQKLEALPRNEFEELIVAYVKDNFKLHVNGQSVTLARGGIKLGDHQTDLRFVLPAFPGPIEDLYVHVPAFRENDHHQTIFSYVFDGEAGHVILAEENAYRATLAFRSSAAGSGNTLMLVLGGVALFLGFFLYNVQARTRVQGKGKGKVGHD